MSGITTSVGENVNLAKNSIAQATYRIINTMRYIYQYTDKEGNIALPFDIYVMCVERFADEFIGEDHDELLKNMVFVNQEILHARSMYRVLLKDIKRLAGIHTPVTRFEVDGSEVGIISKGKVMGGPAEYLTAWFDGTAFTDEFDALGLVKSKEEKDDLTVVNFDPVKYDTKLDTPFCTLSPRQIFIYSKAGDALCSIITNLMIASGNVKNGTTFSVVDAKDNMVFEFLFQQDIWETDEYADHFDFHPRMKFMERYNKLAFFE